MDLLDAIGNTSMVRLRKVVPHTCADIFVKLEWENPTGSLKDRMAEAVISRAEEDGRLKRGDTVVDYTGGSTGTSLALVCAAKGYRLHIVSSDAFSRDKLDHMAALGAELTLVPSEGGLTTRKLILDMIEAARALSREPRTFWTDQLNNADAIAPPVFPAVTKASASPDFTNSIPIAIEFWALRLALVAALSAI